MSNLIPNNNKKNKLNFKEIKKNTICSLFEVNNFLNNYQNLKNYFRFYKIINKLKNK